MDIDLRWGVTEEQAKRGEVLPVCLAEIENCRPYFIGLLGERYGWVPESIDPELVETQPWLAEHQERSITELEILHGVLNNPEMAGHAFFYFRDPGYVDRVSPDMRKDLKAGSPEDREKLNNLKDSIRKKGLRVEENYSDPKALADRVLEDLWKVIDSKYPPVDEPNLLDKELVEHEAFAKSRLGIYIEREEYFTRLDHHIKSEDPPLVLTGESGAGKSALIANWAIRYRVENPSVFLLIHFIGGTPESTDYVRILARIMGELKRRFDLPGEIPTEVSELCRQFPNWLSMASVKGKLVLVLDGLNQLDNRNNAPELGWLPEFFPPNIRVIFSTLPGPSLDALKRREYPLHQVAPLNEEERKKLIADYLWQYRKRLSESQTNLIIRSIQTENPLYLRVLLDELKVFGIHEKLDERIGHYLETNNAEELYERVLARLEEDYEIERPGLTGEILSLIWAARMGLSERELLDLLDVPLAIWSPLYLAIIDFLVTHSGLFGFFHNYLREAVERKYLSLEESRMKAHRRLADYFENSEVRERRVEEFPWQLWQCGDASRLERALSDLYFSRSIWDRNEFDLFTLWSFLEEEDGFKKERTYQKVVKDPIKHNDHLSWISELFFRTGILDMGMRLCKEQEQIYKELGDENGLQISLGKQGSIHQVLGNFDEAMRLHKEQERICTELGNKDGLQMSLDKQGSIHQVLGNLDEAMKLHKESARICKELGNKDGFQISLGNQGVIHEILGNFDDAMRLHEEQERICKEQGNKDGLRMSLNNKAMVHHDQGNLAEAIELFKESEQICKELGDKESFSVSLNNQGVAYQILGNLDEAMRLYKESERICKELGNKETLGISLGNQGEIYQILGNLDKALRLYKESERICKELGDKDGFQTSLNSQGLIYQILGNLDEALKLHKKAAQICKEMGNKDSLSASFSYQGAVHLNLGDLDEALKLHKKAEQICKEMGNPSGLGHSFYNQALVWYEGYHKPEQALPLATKALKLFRKIGMEPQIQEMENLIAKVSKRDILQEE